jgi:signal transduction histidine kinase
MQRLVTFNAKEQRRLGAEIPTIRRNANVVGQILQAVTAAFGFSLMLLVVGAARRYSQVRDERRQFAEARAAAALAFNSRLQAIAKATISIAETITSRAGLQATCRVMADEARAVVGADYCALGLGSDPDGPLEHWVFSGTGPAETEGIPSDLRPLAALGAVQREARPIRVADVAAHAEFRALAASRPAVGPFMGVPLIHQNRNGGTLYLARKMGQPAFTDEDERAAGLLAAYIGVATDNARLYSEAQTAIRAREDLLAIVSHDLRNPLNAIRMSTELLHLLVGDGEAAEVTARIDRATGRMLRMIGDLLDAAKIETGRMCVAGQPEDVASLVEEATEMFSILAAEKTIALCRLTPGSSVTVSCERDLLLRVFSNLIGNAIKFTPREGEIAVAAELQAGQVHFSVKDSGPGIPADHLPHIFDRYWQQRDADRRGSGLGLYIAKGIVEAHGGRIWAESEPGEGSTMHFALPRSSGHGDSAFRALSAESGTLAAHS